MSYYSTFDAVPEHYFDCIEDDVELTFEEEDDIERLLLEWREVLIDENGSIYYKRK